MIVEARLLAWLAEASLGEGDRAWARLLGDEALRASRNRRTPTGECQACLTLARVVLGTDSLAAEQDIEMALNDALQLIEETLARIYPPQVHEERAKLANLRGDHAARGRELREADRLYVEMGATGHVERIAGKLGP